MLVRKILCSSLFLVVGLCPSLAQETTVLHQVYLRADPSTANPPIGTLRKGAKVTLVEATPKNGFYHVRTTRGKEGWVGATYLAAGIQEPTAEVAAPLSSPTGCDDTLWDHVYNSQRLIVKQECISVTGTIVDATNGKRSDGVRKEADGDTHGWLKLDPQFENLLNAGNMSDEGGNLVYEIVCKFKVSQADAKGACPLTYHTPVQLPAVGSHVQIVGSYVQDTFHAQWMEIHPVSKITVIP
ncbi:MAG: SH3 domain-containing protein [Candidatus Sulfotelmatobacter sp.]